MKKIIFLLFSCCIALDAAAQQMYEDKKIDYSYSSLLVEAEKGNVVAMKSLGDCYNFGSSTNRTFKGSTDYAKALELYKKADAYGYPNAAWEIARMYGSGKLKDDGNNTQKSKWHERAFKGFQQYANREDPDAMSYLAEYYGGYYGDDKYKDYIKRLYWSLCALEAGNPSGASDISLMYRYGNGVDKDTIFALAWDARYCIECDKRKWPTEEYPAYKNLAAAGFDRSEWKQMAEPTYMSIPRVHTQNTDSINDAVIFAVDLLNVRAEDFRITYRAKISRHATAGIGTSTTQQPVTSALIPETTATTATPAPKKRVNWLSAIGRALDAANAAVSGQGFAGIAQAVANNTATESAGNGSEAAMSQAFKYNGEERKGQKDFNGRTIKNEYTAPAPMGKAHYTWYEDGYCFAYSVYTCVGCYGKKICTLCNGQGKTYNSYFKTYKQCISCLGSGRCKYCKGAGMQTMSKLWAPGEAEAYQAAKKEEREEERSSSRTNTSSKSGTCPKCGGTGYEPQAYTYAAGSSMAPYHNSGGTTCSICSKATDHYHYRCTECKRH